MSKPTDTERLDYLIRMGYVPARWRRMLSFPTDTDQLDYMIQMGYVPARWRPWNPAASGEPPPDRNGLVWLGLGGRAEIDAAMERSLEACSPPPPIRS